MFYAVDDLSCPFASRTLAIRFCNSCSAPLDDRPITGTDNLLSCFCLGIEQGRFPLRIGVRYETDEVLVFDDILALTPCHLLAVPTRAWVPDWRYLLAHPEAGLRLLRGLRAAGESVVKNQFWANDAFRAKYWRNVFPNNTEQNMDDQHEIKNFRALCDEHTVFGFNYPPSQWHLHLQIAVSPWLPFHQDQMHVGNHMHWGRFFTYDFVVAVLEELCRRATDQIHFPSPESEDRVEPFLEIIEANLDIRYADYHRRAIDSALRSQQVLASYDPCDFEKVVLVVAAVPGAAGGEAENSTVSAPATAEGGSSVVAAQGTPPSSSPTKVHLATVESHKVVLDSSNFAVDASADASGLQVADKLTIQNYGRPYDVGAGGKVGFSLGYYSKGLLGDEEVAQFARRKWWEWA